MGWGDRGRGSGDGVRRTGYGVQGTGYGVLGVVGAHGHAPAYYHGRTQDVRERLMALDEKGRPIRVAIIGCGRFGSMMVAQITRAPGMRVAVLCDLVAARAEAALLQAGCAAEDLVTAGSVSGVNDAIRKVRTAVTDNPQVALEADVDVVVEATGVPDAGALHAHDAIVAGKHVVMVNVEADVLVGPVLKSMADSAGVVYSLAYGDQPAVVEDLYDWAASMGFEVVAAGKGTKYLPEYRHGTPDDALVRYGYSAEEAANGELNPQMYNSFLDGTKSAVEMCAVANMTGLLPDVPGMHFPPAGVEELPALLVPAEDGGILSRKGVVEVVSCLRRDGTDVPNSLRWGVYVVITSDSAYLRRCLLEYGVPMDPSGRYGVMYRPYHLVGMEAPASIARAFLYGEPTGAPTAHVGEVVATAKRPLKPGDVLDGEGGYTAYGALVEATQASAEGLLPIGLCHGARVVRPVEDGQMLSQADVEMPPEGGFALDLRQLQDETHHPAPKPSTLLPAPRTLHPVPQHPRQLRKALDSRATVVTFMVAVAVQQDRGDANPQGTLDVRCRLVTHVDRLVGLGGRPGEGRVEHGRMGLLGVDLGRRDRKVKVRCQPEAIGELGAVAIDIRDQAKLQTARL